MRRGHSFDTDAGVVAALGAAIYVAVVCGIRGLLPGRISGIEFTSLLIGSTLFALAVGGVIAGRPDFGPTQRAALVRGFLAMVPLYAAGGLLFLAPEQWVPVLVVFSLAPAALVGPPIGVFMYRLFRRQRGRPARPGIVGWYHEQHDVPQREDPSVHTAWQKGELLGSWTPLLISVALFASFGLGSLAIEIADLELSGLRTRTPRSVRIADRLPGLYEAVRADSNDARARFALGVALTSVGRFDAALRELTFAARQDSSRVDHWRMLGRAAFYAGRTEVAFEAYWNAQRLDPAVVQTGGLDWVIWDSLLNADG